MCTTVWHHLPSMLISYVFRAALGANPDRKLIDETLEYIMTKARDQDVIYYYRSLATNPKARRIAAEFFKENYDVVRKQRVRVHAPAH